MKHYHIKSLAALVLGTLLLTGCEKATVDEEMLLGSWGYEEAVNMPVIMSLYEGGNAKWYIGPGCFGEAHTTNLKWELADKGHRVYFRAEGQTTPSIKWELSKRSPDTLFVKERLRQEDGKFSDDIDRIYVRERTGLN